MSLVLELAQRLQDTAFATDLAESRYEFPALEGFHLIGLGLSVGLITLIDLRLAGVFLRTVPSNDVLRQLRPWVLAGFVLTFISGTLLFCAEAVSVLESPIFPYKLLFILLAGVNALYFEWRLSRHAGTVPAGGALAGAGVLPIARAAGLASLTLWMLVVATGRLIPYLSAR